MKCLILISGKNKNNIINQSSAEFAKDVIPTVVYMKKKNN